MRAKNFFIFMALLFGCLIGFFQIHNSDVWWHIAWGNQMLQQLRSFPAAESFYFTPISIYYLRDLPNNFLGDIGLALLYKISGTIGLQLLVLLCLFAGGAAAILSSWKKEHLLKSNISCCFLLLLFFAFCLGTSQLQVVRNSLISLALFPSALAMTSWHCRQKNWKPLLLYPGFFLGWSLIHSSYILAIIAVMLLYTGLLLESLWKKSSSLSPSKTIITLILLLFISIISLTYSWQPRVLLMTSAAKGWDSLSKVIHHSEKSTPLSISEKKDLAEDTLSSLTKPVWGNNTLPLSGDFIPTWSVMRYPAAWSSMTLSFFALLLLLIVRTPNRLGMLTVLGMTTYFGFCYLRGTGYATIAAVFVISTTLANARGITWNKNFLWFQKTMTTILGLLCLLALAGMMKLVASERSEYFFMEKGRTFAIGKAAVFDDLAYDFVKTHFLNAPCFTTMVTGSYASCRWHNEKKVFIDSFFAPHSNRLWHDYNRALATESTNILDQYGIQTALIENSRTDWQSIFLSTGEWRPCAIGIGVTIYAKKNSLPPDEPVAILFTADEVAHLSSCTSRRAVAAAYYNCILSLQLHGMSSLAKTMIEQHQELFKTLIQYLEPSQQGNIRVQPPGIKPELLSP